MNHLISNISVCIMVATQESLESKSERCEISLLAVLFVAATGCSIAVGGIYLLVLMVVTDFRPGMTVVHTTQKAPTMMAGALIVLCTVGNSTIESLAHCRTERQSSIGPVERFIWW